MRATGKDDMRKRDGGRGGDGVMDSRYSPHDGQLVPDERLTY